ncbi:MAG TPA: DUF6361 family protein [Geminicoccus sp.]|uniref:DUF6361 family protein n=1 Tax=Geminicoccus sp. TaxID=2024832 RepID=UPI002CAC2A14|nr:DUF6361 family protein [Geminicoccus sp.]HWL69434.1 DUF6361 family protein [Geminicoccus sp.]
MTGGRPEPAIGWFMLSEADRNAATRYLSKLASDGTRDELGFAPVHFAFADRFFPGTSVQHAQLRYVFFVAWSYDELLKESAGRAFPAEALIRLERRYSLRLIKSVGELENSGISGWMKYVADQRPVIRASTIYWTALRSWRVVAPLDGTRESPTESALRRSWPHLIDHPDGDGARAAAKPLFQDLPAPPADWRSSSGPLRLDLTRQEADFIRGRWRAAGTGPEPTLMSKLVEAGVRPKSLWSLAVRRLASPGEKVCLDLARRAASVACVARAAHAALIERQRNEDLGLDDSVHAEALPALIAEHREATLELDVGALRRETGIDGQLAAFIEAVQNWLRAGRGLEALHPVIAQREHDLKQGRAFLANERRRADWRKGIATPLDYRWPIVRGMISRIAEAA